MGDATADITCGRQQNYWNTLGHMLTKPRKPAKERRDAHLRVRLTEDHMDEIKAAAASAGISVSAWVTERCLRCARQESSKNA